jgi:putative ubiquitin-RnfH superfamily antitoxin RatB of RatAB toxin-antitoxin module
MDRADAPPTIAVTVACSPRAGVVDEVSLTLARGATLADALAASGLLERHPTLEAGPKSLGIWGRLSAPDAVLREGDRVEVYRPLQVDPMEARRLRQRRQRAATCSPKR